MEAMRMLLVGTEKGLFKFALRNAEWAPMDEIDFASNPVHATAQDPNTGRIYCAVNSMFWGHSVRRSDDCGKTWDTGTSPSYDSSDPEQVRRVWALQVHPQDGGVYAGVEASGLFRSDDGGEKWREVASLRRHPTHEAWQPGGGGKCLHTIGFDTREPQTMFIAASAGGIYRSRDGGQQWTPINLGIRAGFRPEGQQYPEAGQCVHRFALSPTRPGRIWLQNHGGVYRSDDDGDSWQDVGQGLPSDFGFPIAAHPRKPDTAFVIPVSDALEGRWFPDGRAAVYRTDDGGGSWTACTRGLPDRAYTGVLRSAFAVDDGEPVLLAFGTTSGSVFVSQDDGDSWREVASHLPRILAVGMARAQ